MSWVKAETTSVSVAAVALGVALVASHSDPVVLWVGRVEVPVARSNVSLRVLGTWGSANVRRPSGNVGGSKRDRQVNSINDLDVVEI